MQKKYTFEFLGTKDAFLNQLKKLSDTSQKFFHFDNYIVELRDDEIRFGVSRGSHSGGYWFIPEIKEYDNKISFCGTIEYIGFYSEEKGIKKVVNKIDELFILNVLFPIIAIIFAIIYVRLFFSWIGRKLFKKNKPKEVTLEDKLYNLMEKYLNCTRQ